MRSRSLKKLYYVCSFHVFPKHDCYHARKNYCIDIRHRGATFEYLRLFSGRKFQLKKLFHALDDMGNFLKTVSPPETQCHIKNTCFRKSEMNTFKRKNFSIETSRASNSCKAHVLKSLLLLLYVLGLIFVCTTAGANSIYEK